MHERLRNARDRLARQKAARQQKGADKTADEERLEAHVDDLEAEVDELTRQSEKAVRDNIDKRAELEDEIVILGDLYTHAAANTRANAQRDGEEAGDAVSQILDQSTFPSTVDAYREQRAQKLAEYSGMTMQQRYALNNDYAGFKKLWHDAAVGEDGPPLPHKSKWFRADGEPVMTGAAVDGDDSDDDIAVSREIVSINCPLSLQPMQNPYSNRKCKHTFEKSALLEYLGTKTSVQCPQTGCSQVSPLILYSSHV
jgi:hypothetical protein